MHARPRIFLFAPIPYTCAKPGPNLDGALSDSHKSLALSVSLSAQLEKQ